MFANNPLPMWVYDLETLQFLEVNEAAIAQYGYSRAEFLAMRIADIRPSEDVPRLLANIERTRPPLQASGEWRHRRKDARIIDVQITSHILDFAGRRASLVVAWDITQRKQAEQEARESAKSFHALNAQLEQRVLEQTAELREAKAFLETLVTQGPSVIFKLDGVDTPTRAMTYISPNIERILGYRPEEVLGVSGFWEAHLHPEDRERLRATTAAALRERRTQFDQEGRIRHKDGSYRWMHSIFRVEYDQSGAPASIFGYDRDVTDRRAAEAAIKEAKLEAERANQAKSEFLSRMSHELRTPLNAILGFAQLLGMDSLSSQQSENLEYILKGGRYLLELINEVLDIARIEAGRLAISLEPVATREAVEGVLDLMRPVAAEMNVQLNGGGPSPPERYILADAQRLKQVLLNFLSNAIKYNHRGGIVTLGYEETPAGRLRIEVSDTGPGIPPDKMERLFIPFERLGAERTSTEGTGLGLALSKRLVEAMGGTLGVESTVGKGSTFWAEFPVVKGPLARLTPHQPEEPGADGLDASSDIATVLYVEDNLSNLELIQRLLTRRPGVRLLPAMQGQLGFDLARRHHPDLILLDLHLPDIPGDEVLRRLQAAPDTQNVPVVVISADATPSRIARLLAAGAWQYLTKPLDVKRFLALLDEALKAPKGGRAARSD
ncbi:MAG TPA: ATP-binding protein [bacterium]|nr:ATP-binding protein [bacterium]